MTKVKLGFAPTRRSIFSAPDAVKYANLTRKKLEELGVEFVDINDIVYDKYGNPYTDAEEINRRLYVACSRSKNKLYLKYGK